MQIGRLQLDRSNLNVTTMQMTGFTKLKQAYCDSHSCPPMVCSIAVMRILCTLPQTTCVFPCISSACKLRTFSYLVKAQVQKTVVSQERQWFDSAIWGLHCSDGWTTQGSAEASKTANLGGNASRVYCLRCTPLWLLHVQFWTYQHAQDTRLLRCTLWAPK